MSRSPTCPPIKPPLSSGHTAPGAIVRLNGANVPVNEEGTFTVSVTLKEGVNEFRFAGTDVASNEARVVRRITLDTTPPPLKLN